MKTIPLLEIYRNGNFEKIGVHTLLPNLNEHPQGTLKVPVLSNKNLITITYDMEDSENDIHTNFFLRRYLFDSISSVEVRIPFNEDEFTYKEEWRESITLDCVIKSIKPNQGLNSCLEVKTPQFKKMEGFLLNDINLSTICKIVERVLC